MRRVSSWGCSRTSNIWVANILFRVRWEPSIRWGSASNKSYYPPTYASITPILSLSSPSLPNDEEAVKARTRCSSFNYDDLSCCCLWTGRRSQVVHNHGHGFSKRFNPAGVYQLPIIGIACSPISLSFYPLEATILWFSSERSETT